MKTFGQGLALAWLILATVAAHGQGKAEVRLLLSASSIKPGDALMAGIELIPPQGYHTSWRNGGESGLGIPTKVVWVLPPGVTAGPIEWPAPSIFIYPGGKQSADLVTYVYATNVVLLVPLKVAPGVRGPLALRGTVTWAECNERECVQSKTGIGAVLAVGTETVISADAAKLFDWQRKVPQADPKAKVSAVWEKPATGDSRPLVIEWQAGMTVAEAEFFPFLAEKFDVSGRTDVLSKEGAVRLRKKINKFEGDWPVEVAGLVAFRRAATAEREFFETKIPITASAGVVATDAAPSTVSGQGPPPVLLMILGGAFLGGLILNFMPCVLPVIALKILGFVQQSKESPARVRKLGLIYGVGVVASFLVLAGMVVGLQHAGRSVTWGTQMQYPVFRVVMIGVTVLIALNLFGVFEVAPGGAAMDAAGALAAKDGAAGAFFNGVLATALATPCTAPFLAGALGWAFTQSSGVIFATFTSAAAGMAAPYVLLSLQPAWLKFLPKPGAWMQRFKVGMGFPMLATTVWLFDFTAGSFGEGGALWLGFFVVTLGLVAWIWGEFVQRGRKNKVAAMVVCFVLAGAGYGWFLEHELHWRNPTPRARQGATENVAGGIEWKTWSVAAVEQARAEGHVVLLDFTAKWCATCRVNKSTSIEIASVRAKLKEINAEAFVADNTDLSPEIDAELKRHGRAGLPLVLVFPKDASKPALVLPGLLTPDVMLNALDAAAK